MAIRIVLTSVEMQQAAMVGVLRRIEGITRGLTNRYGADSSLAWTLDIEGAAGELAAAKALDRHWGMPVNTYRHGGDVGYMQIRTRSRHDYDLIVRPADRDDDIFVLVTGQAPSFIVRGYIVGTEAKQRRWLRAFGNRPAAYFVPQSALTSIDGLKSSRNISIATERCITQAKPQSR